MTGAADIVPPGWEADHSGSGYVRHVRPFGKLLVAARAESGMETGSGWYAAWVYGNDPAWLVAGPFDRAEDAFAAAVRWLFDSWSAIEAQLEPETPYRRDPVLNMLTGGLVGGLAVALLALALAWWH